MDIQDCHVLRGNKTTGFPQRLMFLDTETKSTFRPEFKCDVHEFVLGWCWSMRKKKSGYDPESGKWEYFEDSQALLQHIDESLVKSQPTYLFASNPVYDIGATGFIPYFTERGFEKIFYYSGGMTFMLFLRLEKKVIKVLGMQNFLPTSIAQVGELLGIPKGEVDFETVPMEELKAYCRTDTEILGRGIISYFDFCGKNNLGGFAPSISGQSMRAYRHKFMDHKITIYHGKEIQTIERAAYHGGRCEASRIGKLPEDDYVVLDVNSMYPFVMREHYYPTGLLQARQRVAVSDMESLLEDFCLVAECKIQTSTPMYPVGINGRLCFPTGEFWATLTTPSIEEAISRGHLVKTERVLVYSRAKLFTRYAEFFYTLRQVCQRDGNEVFDYVCKRFLNSLYGKWGEKRDIEIESGHTESDDFYRTQYYNEVTGKSGYEETMFHTYRVVEGWKEAPNSCPSISAHCTDYARCYLFSLMSQIDLHNVIYCDTDSLVVRKEDMKRFFDSQVGKGLGQLKIEQEFTDGEIFGPKDYRFGDKCRQKGIRRNAQELAPGVFRQDQFPSMIGLMAMRVQGGVPVKQVVKHLRREYKKGNVDTDGVVTPFKIGYEQLDLGSRVV